MKDIYANQLEKDQDVTEFFMVKSIDLRTGSNGKTYLDLTLGDKTGDINAKKWDVNDTEGEALKNISEGDIVKIRGQVILWQNQAQLRVQRIRPLAKSDEIEIKDYVKAAPEDPEEMYGYIHGIAESIGDTDLRSLALRCLDDNREKLMYYPAASRNHHAEFAGLLYHMKRMLACGLAIAGVYTDLDADLVACGVIIHDIEKLNEIESDMNGISPGYSFEGQMLGHIVMGVKYIDRLTEELGFSEEKALMMQHMILSHHYEPEYGSPKRPLFPEAEVLHYLDIMDARLFDMYDALATTEPGNFSDRVWTLDNRRIYKPKGEDTEE